MSWLLGNFVLSSGFHNYVLGHYEICPPPDYQFSGSIPGPGLVWVANSMTEVAARAVLVVGLMVFASASILYLAYRAAKNP
jgi:hypothetical protein